MSLPGDVVECGVGAGVSLAVFAQILTSAGLRKLTGIDSFSGFPEATEHDNPNFTPEKWGIYSRFDVSFVRENLARTGLTPEQVSKVELLPGDVGQVLSASDAPISLLHLDLDLYQSYSDALRAGWERLEVGGLVLLDEYDTPNDLKKWPGAKIAVDQFSSARQVKVERHWTGFCHMTKPPQTAGIG